MPSLLRVVFFLLTVSSFVFGAGPPAYSIRPIGVGNGDICTPNFLTPTARSAGTTQLYDSSIGMSQFAWVDDGFASHAAGLTGPDYIDSDGAAFSDVLDLNDSGFAIGYSRNFNLKPRGLRVPWLYQPSTSTTVPLGFTSGPFTASDGSHSATVKFLDGAGRAYGYSLRYENSSSADLSLGPTTRPTARCAPWVIQIRPAPSIPPSRPAPL